MKKSVQKMENTPPHVGDILKEYIKNNNIFKSALARYLKRSAPAIEYHLRRPTMQTNTLWEISLGLKHNFFADLATQLPAEFTSNVPVDKSKDVEIMRLKDENKVLKAQLETLEKVLRKDI